MQYKIGLTSRYQASILQVNDLLAIHSYLQGSPTTQISDNVLRACVTMLVSTIDTFVNELIINSIMFELKERKSVFDLKNIKIDIDVLFEVDIEIRLRQVLKGLRIQYAKQTFQSSRQIENGLSNVGFNKIWKKISDLICEPAEDIKKKLDLLVYRRNQIVHEGDLDHLHNLREIERIDVDNARKFSENLIRALLDIYSDMISVALQA
jgi:hypothetical protein